MSGKDYHTLFLKNHPDVQIGIHSFMKHFSRCRNLMSFRNGFHLTLLHSPNECQVDIGYANFYLKSELCQGYFVAVSFPHSGFAYAQIIEQKNIENVLFGLKCILDYIGRTPKEMWLDNESAIINKDVVHPLFTAFCEHYKIRYEFMNKFCAYEKGNVENRVGYIRRNLFTPIPHIHDVDEYNRELFIRCEEALSRPHHKHGFDMFAQFCLDKETFTENSEAEFIVQSLLQCNPKAGFRISVAEKYYFVPPEKCSKRLDVVLTHNRVKAYNNKTGEFVLDCKRLGMQEFHEVNWLKYLPLLVKSPSINALKPFIDHLPVELRYFLITSDEKSMSELLSNISHIASKNDLDFAVSVALECVIEGNISKTNFEKVAQLKKRPTA